MEITANGSQAVKYGDNIQFQNVRVPGNPSILYQCGSGLVTLRGLCCGQPRARFRVKFTGNLKADAEEEISGVTLLSLALSQNGETLPITTMTVSVGDTTSTYNIATEVLIDVPVCCCQTIAVRNITDNITVDVLNSNLIVERVA